MKNKLLKYVVLPLSLATLVGCGDTTTDEPKEGQKEEEKQEEETRKAPILSRDVTSLEDAYVNSTVTLPTLTATDEVDGDISSQISLTVFNPANVKIDVDNYTFVASSVGTYKVNYSVTNTALLSDTVSYDLNVIDYESPTLTSSTTSLDDIYEGGEVTLPTVTCTDVYDGTITNLTISVKDPDQQDVTVSNNKFSVTKAGEYVITFSATNSHNKSNTLTFKQKVLAEVKPVITSDVTEIKNVYAGQEITLPTISVTDESDSEMATKGAKLSIVGPSGSISSDYKESTFTPNAGGDYELTYTATNKYNKTSEKKFSFSVKDNFVIGWDARMYTTAASGLTVGIMNSYKADLEAYFATVNATNVNIVLRGYSESTDADLGTAITTDGDCDLLVGFTQKIYTEAGSNVSVLTHKTMNVANVASRYICTVTDYDLCSKAASWTLDETNAAVLSNKEIKIAWFKNKAIPEGLLTAVKTAIEAFLTEKGYEGMTVTNILYEKDSTLDASIQYQDVHDRIVADGCTLGINWSTNLRQANNGFGFTSIAYQSGSTAETNRLVNVGTINGAGTRYVAGFVKKNGTTYSFYDDLFNFLSSDTMKAIYTASY